MAHALRGEKTSRRAGLERQVRLAAESLSSPATRTASGTSDGRWISAAEDAENITTSNAAGKSRPSTTRFARTTASRRAWLGGEARAAVPPLAATLHRLLCLGGRRGRVVRRPRQAAATPFRTKSCTSAIATTTTVRYGRPCANIEISIGMYHDQTRQAYFFAGKDSDDRTLYHEATHQLFHESRPVAPDVGRRANFWIVEGIAMYMESLRQEDGYYVLGGFDDERLNAAQFRLLRDKFYVPLQEFVGYGMEKIQKDPRIGTLYSQAAGLTHFLVYYDGAAIAMRWLPTYGRLHGPRPTRHAGPADRDQLRGTRQAVPRVPRIGAD